MVLNASEKQLEQKTSHLYDIRCCFLLPHRRSSEIILNSFPVWLLSLLADTALVCEGVCVNAQVGGDVKVPPV